MGPLGQGLLDPSGIRVVGQLKQGLVSIAPVGAIGTTAVVAGATAGAVVAKAEAAGAT